MDSALSFWKNNDIIIICDEKISNESYLVTTQNNGCFDRRSTKELDIGKGMLGEMTSRLGAGDKKITKQEREGAVMEQKQ